MIRRTIFWLMMWTTGVLLASERGVMLMNRIGPSSSGLYIARSDGAEERRLLGAASFDYHALYAPDGRWIVFTSERTGLGQADIYRARPDGTEVERLTDSPALDDQGTLSPDGTQLAFVSTREMQTANIWILDLRARRLRNLTGQASLQGDPEKPNGFFRPAWSPDGKWIAFSSDRKSRSRQPAKIMMVRRDGSNPATLTEGTPNAGFPSWSPDGTRIVYRVWGSDVQGLRVLDVSTRSVHALTNEYDNLPYWSPDGQRIVFTRRHDGFNFDIFTIRPDGSDLRRLTTSPANDAHAVWTDDGQHIMWNSASTVGRKKRRCMTGPFNPTGRFSS